ncbi:MULTISPECIES: metal ABC transporter permease [Brevibacillus]|jgi:manganese/zinc/iron transport system permease protein|uniref:metal ABC transporter permease n=1 Tax=Brevibacillus TaxID=55080 RepID=UPI0004183104|nr:MULTISPECIES: metal ABC transporter permease [Brevibacillus]TRY26318.1 metal ABC transporter permease [Brevibacillus sp. LEMMJ03]
MNLWLALQDPNTQWVLAGCILLGISSGVLGCFAFLRGRSLMGDALAHAALPGVCLVYLLTGSKSIGLFLIGAGAAGLLATYCITSISRHSRIKEDTALALTLSVFFGIGIVLLTYIQHSASGNQSGLDKFLFGQAASLVSSDVTTMMIVSGALILLTILLFKEFTLLSFDAGFGRGLGFPMGFLDALLMLMLLMTVVIGLQAVGVVLVAAMLIAPAVTARYWTDKLSVMAVLSGLFGAFSGALGTLLSTQLENLPTGPTIVLAATCFFVISLLVSPRRGVLVRLIRFLRLRSKVLHEDVMQALYERMEEPHHLQAGSLTFGIEEHELAEKSGKSTAAVRKALRGLRRQGYVRAVDEASGHRRWTFTPEGLKKAHGLVLNQRLWDVYHMNEDRYASQHIDVNREELASQLSDETLAQMLEQLHAYNLTPKLNQHVPAASQLHPTNRGGLSV